MLNQCQFIGNLGRDAETRTFQNGDKVCNLRIAVTEKWKDRDGNKKERTEWVSVAIFGPLVNVAESYLRKGSKVYISGKMRTRKWQDQSGQDRYSTEVVLQGPDAKLVMLDGPQQGGQNGGGYGGGGYDQSPGGYRDDRDRGPDGGAGGQRNLDDEIPFAPEWRI